MIATTVCLARAVVELLSGAVMRAIIFGAAGLCLAWQFFVALDAPSDVDPRSG